MFWEVARQRQKEANLSIFLLKRNIRQKETKLRSVQFGVWLWIRNFKPMEAKASGNYSMRVSNGTKKLQLLIKCCSLVLPRNHIGFDIFLSFILQLQISLSLLCFPLSFSSLQLWNVLIAVNLYKREGRGGWALKSIWSPVCFPHDCLIFFHNKIYNMNNYIM